MKTRVVDNINLKVLEQKTEMEAFLKQLVLIESPTEDHRAQGPLLRIIEIALSNIGYKTIRMPGKISGGYLYARPEKRKKNRPLQLLIGHCDTVWPINTLDTMPFIEGNDKLNGPGVYDMKAGLTQILFSLRTLKELNIECPYTPVILINSDEERGSKESTKIIKRLAKISKRAFVMEPPLNLDGRLKTSRKGLGRFTVTVNGKPAHAGLDPGKGASAILELSHQIQKLFSLNNIEKGITVNVGLIEGGINPNVVAPVAKAVVDVRVLTRVDSEVVSQKIRELKPLNPDTTIVVEGFFGRLPMEKTPRNRQLWLLAKSIGEDMGIDLKEGTAGGGSDGNTTSLFTATLDGLGTNGDGAHAHHEFVFREKLLERTILLTHLLKHGDV